MVGLPAGASVGGCPLDSARMATRLRIRGSPEAGARVKIDRTSPRKAVAFYPGCRLPLVRGDWHARAPLLILIDADDDWTPAKPCEDLARIARASGEPVSIVVYPVAYHDFDHPDLTVHETHDLAFTADGSGSAHTGTNPTARADAIKRVPAFLARSR